MLRCGLDLSRPLVEYAEDDAQEFRQRPSGRLVNVESAQAQGIIALRHEATLRGEADLVAGAPGEANDSVIVIAVRISDGRHLPPEGCLHPCPRLAQFVFGLRGRERRQRYV